MDNRTIYLTTDKNNNLQLLNIKANFKDWPKKYQTEYSLIGGPFNEDEILQQFSNLKSKMITLISKSETNEETKSIYSIHNTNNENEISESKNIWIVSNENDQLEIIYADNLQDISEEWKDRIVAGPLTQQQLKYRILELDLIDEGIAKAKKENEQYWIVEIVGSHFKLAKGCWRKISTECSEFMKKNVRIAKIQYGPYDDKNEALENLNVFNYNVYGKPIPIHWIITYDDKTFEVFYGNEDALKIKLADGTCVAHGPFLHKDRIEYTKNNMFGHCKLRKPDHENGNRFVSQLIESGYRKSLKEIQDSYLKINADYPNIQYSVLAGPFTSDQANKYIKNLKEGIHNEQLN